MSKNAAASSDTLFVLFKNGNKNKCQKTSKFDTVTDKGYKMMKDEYI